MYKKPEIDLSTVSNVHQYQQDYIACNSLAYSHSNGHGKIATSTAIGVVTGAVGSVALDAIVGTASTVASVSIGAVSGGLGNYLFTSWEQTYYINRSTAMCLIGRDYTLLDHDWWLWAYENYKF